MNKMCKVMLQNTIKLENICRPWQKFQNLINVGPLIRLQDLEKKSKIDKRRAYIYTGLQSRRDYSPIAYMIPLEIHILLKNHARIPEHLRLCMQYSLKYATAFFCKPHFCCCSSYKSTGTGKSLSEALLFAEHGVNMLRTKLF